MFSKEYIENYKTNLKLAYPIVLGQVGHLITTVADTIMVGSIGSEYVAAGAIAHSVFFIIFVIGIGIATGITPLTGIAYGEKNRKRTSEIYRTGLLVNTLVGVLLMSVMFIASENFHLLRQPARVTELAVPYFRIIAMSMFPVMLFMHFKQFTEGLSLVKPGMIVSIGGNLFNVGLNWVLIFGKFGFEPMELNGAGWATFVSRTLMAASFGAYVYFGKDVREFISEKGRILVKDVREVFKIGLPISAQYLMEVGAFTFGGIMVGWSKPGDTAATNQLAAHQISISMAAITYLASSGIASAATIRLSNYIGEKKFSLLKIAGNSNFVMVLVFMSLTALTFILGRNLFPALYVDEPEVIAVSATLLVVAAFFQLFDGMQVVALGALRGMEDVTRPTLLAFIAYWVLAIPASYYFGVFLQLGARGIWYGYLIGLSFAAVALYLRFRVVVTRVMQEKKVAIN
jgi:MATE family multidrug resistance protein